MTDLAESGLYNATTTAGESSNEPEYVTVIFIKLIQKASAGSILAFI